MKKFYYRIFCKFFYFMGVTSSSIYLKILMKINPNKAQEFLMVQMEKANNLTKEQIELVNKMFED